MRSPCAFCAMKAAPSSSAEPAPVDISPCLLIIHPGHQGTPALPNPIFIGRREFTAEESTDEKDEAEDPLSERQSPLLRLSGGRQRRHPRPILSEPHQCLPRSRRRTGTNLASTFRAIAEGAEAKRSIKETLKSIANAALYGAQGNSGLIFAQFLHGMSKEVGHHEWMLTTKASASRFKRAAQHAYAAIVHPVEGTMITVIREWARSRLPKGIPYRRLRGAVCRIAVSPPGNRCGKLP